MKFLCSIHGEFKDPKYIIYSCPAQAYCPVCGISCEDLEGGLHIIDSEKEGVLLHPNLYKKHFPEIYKKYFPDSDSGNVLESTD